MDSNFEIIKSLYENECQRIVECRDIKTGDIFIYNTIFNQKLIKLIDINTLNSINSNIVKCYKTQDRLYIVTKPHELSNQKILKEYIDTNNLTLKQQFVLTEQLINLFVEIYNVTDLLQYKILSFDNLSVSENDALFVNGYFEFKDEYDLSDNYSYKNLGNIIHYLFSKEDIVDYNISDTIPPDILKIIVKCLTREYFHPKDILKEFENSPIYSIINCKTDIPVNKTKMSDLTKIEGNESINENKNTNIVVSNVNDNDEELDTALNSEDNCSDTIDVVDSLSENEIHSENKDDDSTDNLNIIDIYLNNAADDKSNNAYLQSENSEKSHGRALKFIIPAFIIIFVTVVSVLLIKNLYNSDKDKETGSNNVISDQNNNSNKDDSKDSEKDNNNNEDVANDNKDQSQLDNDTNEFKLYLNDALIKDIGYTGKLAVVDTENYNDGKSSLLVENDTEETVKVLFAVIDFKNDKLSYLKNNQIGIAAKFKALNDVDAKLVVEAYMDNKLSVNNSGKVQIFDDIWSQKEITIKVGDIDRVNLYIEYAGKNKVWIDTLAIDILK